MIKGVILTDEEFEELNRELQKYKDFYYLAQRSVKNKDAYLKCGHNDIVVDIKLINEILGYDISKEQNNIRLKG